MLTDALRVRGSWRVDETTGEIEEFPRADAYAEKVELERRLLPESSGRRVVRLCV